MKKLFTAGMLAVVCAATPALAQTDAAKAKTILDAVSKKVGGLKTMKADFTLKLTGGKGSVNDSRKGSVALKGQKYYVSIGGQEIMCDNATVWTYNKEAKEVQVSKYNPAEQSLSPAKLFTPSYFDKEYTYSYKGARTVAGKSCDVIELTPKDKSKQIAKIELLVDKANTLIAGGTYWEKNGNQYAISVSDIKQNADLPDTYFAWNAKAHPGVEVVDLR